MDQEGIANFDHPRHALPPYPLVLSLVLSLGLSPAVVMSGSTSNGDQPGPIGPIGLERLNPYRMQKLMSRMNAVNALIPWWHGTQTLILQFLASTELPHLVLLFSYFQSLDYEKTFVEHIRSTSRGIQSLNETRSLKYLVVLGCGNGENTSVANISCVRRLD